MATPTKAFLQSCQTLIDPSEFLKIESPGISRLHFTMEPSAKEILEVLYQELDQSLRRIWEKDKQLTTDLKYIHLDFVSQYSAFRHT